MSIHTVNAKKIFYENLKLVGSPHTEPERHNLYSGMLALLDALSHIENQIEGLAQEVRAMRLAEK
jgi:hypothetical protein